jgi:hypothetical protein
MVFEVCDAMRVVEEANRWVRAKMAKALVANTNVLLRCK